MLFDYMQVTNIPFMQYNVNMVLLGLVMLVQSSAIITSSIYHNITYGAGSTVTEYKSDFKLTTDTPYLTPICEL